MAGKGNIATPNGKALVEDILKDTPTPRTRRSRLERIISITLMGTIALPLVFWQSGSSQFSLALWITCPILTGLALMVVVHTRNRQCGVAARNWHLASLAGCFASVVISIAVLIALFPWLAPEAGPRSPDKDLWFAAMFAVAMIALAGITAAALAIAAPQPHRANELRPHIANKLRPQRAHKLQIALLLTITASCIGAFVFKSETAIATVTLTGFALMLLYAKVNRQTFIEVEQLKQSSKSPAIYESPVVAYKRSSFPSAAQIDLEPNDYHPRAIVDPGQSGMLDAEHHARRESEQQIELEDRFRTALVNGEITFWCQPIVTADARHPVAVELLARWQQPNGTRISPAEFIPIAQQTSLIIELGKQALAFAAELLHRWSGDSHLSSLAVNINLSPQHLRANLMNDIRQVFPQLDSRLGIEFNESGLMLVANDQRAHLQTLVDNGIRLIIDDFGVSNTSLSSLRSLPVNEVKIDRSLIHRLEADPARQALIGEIIRVTQTLNVSCVAAGIETRAAACILNHYGVNQLQGFEIAAPQPITQAEQTLHQLITSKAINKASQTPEQWPINSRSALEPDEVSAIRALAEEQIAY